MQNDTKAEIDHGAACKALPHIQLASSGNQLLGLTSIMETWMSKSQSAWRE